MKMFQIGWKKSRRSARMAAGLATASILVFSVRTACATKAESTVITHVSTVAGATPFIRNFNFRITPAANLKSVQFTIQPKPGSVTRPISATYSDYYLTNRGFLNDAGNLKVPVFGLYDDFANTVTVNFVFYDNSSKQNTYSVRTSAFKDPCGYKNPMILKSRSDSTQLSYDFMLLRGQCSEFSPTIMDTDGALRWVGTAGVAATPSIFLDNAVYIGSGKQLLRIEMDGAVRVVGDYSNLGVKDFHHNIDPGKIGLLLEVDTSTDVESVILEVDRSGNVHKLWNMALIISRAMRDGGDDPSGFVLRGQDWFHNNSATYRASDDSLIVSSRENFVIALDYRTSQIKWILGDPNKAWYQYPSLRQYALKVPVGVPPIGQHSVSITHDDKLLLFDDGYNSFVQSPPGLNRTFAAPRKYSLNLEYDAAREIWHYNRGIISEICSSVYEDAPNDYLVDYAVAGGYQSANAFAELVGLEDSGRRVFDYKYPTHFCDEIFNALPIHLEQLSFNRVNSAFDVTP